MERSYNTSCPLNPGIIKSNNTISTFPAFFFNTSNASCPLFLCHLTAQKSSIISLFFFFEFFSNFLLTFFLSFGIINKSSRDVTDMRKCRNWQTSKTKDLVAIAVVWVQVPSSALRKQRLKREIVWVFSFFAATNENDLHHD